MINDQRYVILSLELHLFFSRIMKEHAIFLKAGFTSKDSNLANEAEHYKNEFEKLLSYTVDVSDGIISSDVLNSGEIITDFTLGTEMKTQNLTGIEINQNITNKESQLHSGTNPNVSSNLVNYVDQLNLNSQRLLRGLINFKQRVLNGVLSCNIFTTNYPSFTEHVIHEAQFYLSLVNNLVNRIDIESKEIRESELFWDHIMMEHALFIRGLLDPTEENLIDTADEFANEFRDLIKEAQDMTDATISSITNETLNKTIQFKIFNEEGTDGIARCKIRSIILPLLADHVLREANRYIRLLEAYKGM